MSVKAGVSGVATPWLIGRGIDLGNSHSKSDSIGPFEAFEQGYSAASLTAGQLVYESGFDSGTQAKTLSKSNAGSTTKPAVYVVLEDSAAGLVPIARKAKVKVTSFDCSAATVGDNVYLSTTDGTPTLSGGSGLPVVGKVAVAANPGTVEYNIDELQQTVTSALPTRISLVWQAGRRGKPGLNADIQNATESVRMIADPDFELLGTNATSASSSFNAEGGIKLTTAGASGDQVILLPHLDANQSAWAQFTWGTDKQTEWEGDIVTGSAITAEIVWAGLKLTNTPPVATDNDQVFFRYEAGVNSGKWQVISSIGGTDTTTDSGITVAVSTRYHLRVTIDASRIARAYINGKLIVTTAALTDATDLIPYVGVAAGAAAAKDITVYGEAISRIAG